MKIKEPLLKQHHEKIIECFVENNIAFSAEYDDQFGTKYNSTVVYTITINDVDRIGFICVNKGKFGGAIFKNEWINYYEKEGFPQKKILSDLPICAEAPCPAAFIMMLAAPIMNDLVIQEGLMEEFRDVVKKLKAKNKKK